MFFPNDKGHAAEELYLSIWSLHDLQKIYLSIWSLRDLHSISKVL